MLARINGANSGIREYLENGLKQGREYGRDELDNRLILDGNIQHLDNVINSIEDKGQERYLHITLSFAEDNITPETLKAVTEDYKSLLMNAYHEDEYCFYAEAHLPKIKNLTNESTGEVYERKPHIHIVIPETNLVTGNKLNPTGMVDHYIKNLDSIQEHINAKYNLASPKDSIRVSDNNHANVLSRYKGDFFKGRESAVKKEIVNDLDAKNIRTEKDFLDNLAHYGEVKTYNKGKANQYYGVKLPDNDKFTRLKSPLFSEQYITRRELPHVKPTAKEVEKNLSQWLERTSHEIKHIHPSSPKNRAAYKAATDEQKTKILSAVRDKYNERYNLTDNRDQDSGRTLSARRLIERGFKVSRQRPDAGFKTQRLPSMQTRHMVHQLSGFRRPETNKSDAVLPALQRNNVAEVRQAGQYHRGRVRWTPDNRGGVNSALKQTLHDMTNKPGNRDLEIMREIRTKIEPKRFLAYCADKYKIDPKSHAVTFAKDGSPRFNAGKKNLNASDFLTKYLNIDWKEAKEDLITIYNGQLNNTRYNINGLDKDNERTVNRISNQMRKQYYQELRVINKEYRTELFKLNKIKDSDKKEVERGFILFNHLKRTESLNTITAARNVVVNEIRADLPQKRGNNMAEIYTADKDLSTLSRMEKLKKLQQFQSDIDKGVKLTDLVCNKKDKELTFLDKKSQKEVFTDKGSHLHVPDINGKEKVALALEYAEKKFGGKLQLSGSEQFKVTAAITAAEKGMNIILTPDKYHQMMLDHAEKMKQEAAAKPEQAAGQERATITQGTAQELTTDQHKQAQAEIIQKNNPMQDDIHTGINDVSDIKTFKEAMSDFSGTPDFTKDMADKAMNEEKITVYSSKPIEQGTFVTPSKMEAESYAGGEPVHSKEVSLKDVAWIDSIEGQYAKVPELKQTADPIKNVSESAPEAKQPTATPDPEKIRAAVESTPNPATPSQLKDVIEQASKPEAGQTAEPIKTVSEPAQEKEKPFDMYNDIDADMKVDKYIAIYKGEDAELVAVFDLKDQDLADKFVNELEKDIKDEPVGTGDYTTSLELAEKFDTLSTKDGNNVYLPKGHDLYNMRSLVENIEVKQPTATPDQDKVRAAVESTPNPATPSQLKDAVEQASKPEAGQTTKRTIDGQEFNKLIVVPEVKTDGYEKSVSFKVAFKQDDKIVSELHNVKESDLQRMGIDTKGIDMRQVQPVNIQSHSIKSQHIESPIKHAERQLNDFKASVMNKEFSADDFRAMKAERAKLEENVALIRKTHTPEQKPEQNQTAKQSETKGMSR